MSNTELSAAVLQSIPCICGLYTSFDSNGENSSLKVRRGVYKFMMGHDVPGISEPKPIASPRDLAPFAVPAYLRLA